LIGIGVPRTRTPATPLPVDVSVARPLIVRATGVGFGAGVVGGDALGVRVALEDGIVVGCGVL
jgi:hypothetical protein